MNDLKHIKRFNESNNEDNTSGGDKNVFSITEEQLSELIEKLGDKIKGVLNKEGKSTKGLDLANSVSDTIKAYLEKNCC